MAGGGPGQVGGLGAFFGGEASSAAARFFFLVMCWEGREGAPVYVPMGQAVGAPMLGLGHLYPIGHSCLAEAPVGQCWHAAPQPLHTRRACAFAAGCPCGPRLTARRAPRAVR